MVLVGGYREPGSARPWVWQWTDQSGVLGASGILASVVDIATLF